MTIKDWVTTSLAVLAFFLSAFTAFYSFVRRLDELSVIINETPSIAVYRDKRELSISEGLKLVFVNSGTRPMAVLGIDVVVDETNLTERLVNSPACQTEEVRRWLRTDAEAFVIKEKEILSKELKVVSVDTDTRREEGVIMMPTPKWFEKKTEYLARLCVMIRIASPTTAHIIKMLELTSHYQSSPDATFLGGYAIETRPLLVWRERSTIFDD